MLVEHTEPIYRSGILLCYAENIASYIHAQHPEKSYEEILKWVEADVQEWFKVLRYRKAEVLHTGGDLDEVRNTKDNFIWPTCQIVRACADEFSKNVHSYGNLTFFQTADLLEVINQYRDKIISPFGSFYETTDKCKSFLGGMIGIQKKQRKKEKKLMAEAQRNGDKAGESFHKNLQTLIKINMNSMPGGMGSAHNFLSSKANYNSVTSFSRYCIMNSYAHAERFLEANFYFRTDEQLINHLIACMRDGPAPLDVELICKQYGIHEPTTTEVFDFVVRCLHRYMFQKEHPRIFRLIDSMPQGTKDFVFYMSNMKHLVTKNEAVWRPWLDKFFTDPGNEGIDDIDPTEMYKLDGDLVTVLATIHNKEIPVNKRGNPISIYETIEVAPQLAKRLVKCGKQMQACIDEMQPLFDIFMEHHVGIGYVGELKNMFRDAVGTSDTDSILFTTRSWIEWYFRELRLDEPAFNLNALVVYWLSKANTNILFHLSTILGATGPDLRVLAMKNEFMMPVEILTTLKKHYMALLAIQEGVVYTKPRLDVKGVGLRGSNFSKGVLNFVNWFIEELITEIYKRGKVSAVKYLTYVLEFERMVFDSLYDGYTEFLTIEPVKNADEYKDADRTIYFNFLFWEEVFGEKYGNIAVPTKCYVLPLTNIKHYSYMYWLQEHAPDTAEKLRAFLEKNSKKNISRIPINPFTNKIPEELRQVTNYKAVIYANTRPLYLILSSLGVTTGATSKQNVLFSDQYGWVTKEAADNARRHANGEA